LIHPQQQAPTSQSFENGSALSSPGLRQPNMMDCSHLVVLLEQNSLGLILLLMTRHFIIAGKEGKRPFVALLCF